MFYRIYCSWIKHTLYFNAPCLLICLKVPPGMYEEYMTTSHCTKEVILLRQLLAYVGFMQERATSIMCNNQGCIAFAKNPTHHSCTKQINVQHHFIWEKLGEGEISLKCCPMEDMITCMLTKTRAYGKHQGLNGIACLWLLVKWECWSWNIRLLVVIE